MPQLYLVNKIEGSRSEPLEFEWGQQVMFEVQEKSHYDCFVICDNNTPVYSDGIWPNSEMLLFNPGDVAVIYTDDLKWNKINWPKEGF